MFNEINDFLFLFDVGLLNEQELSAKLGYFEAERAIRHEFEGLITPEGEDDDPDTLRSPTIKT